jgi:dTDP-4-dehydrorhamnose reductase
VGFKILLTEHLSPLGSALLRGFEAHSLSVVSSDGFDAQNLREQVDLHQPAVIINPQSLVLSSGQDLVEQGHTLLELSRLHDSVLIHFSSHQVFGASQSGAALSEFDTPLPEDPFGRELLAQEAILKHWERSLIVRLPWLLDGPDGVLDTICRALLYGDECVVSEAWRGAPVFIEDVVRITLGMVQQILCGASNWGIFHLHSSDSCSEAELADHIARLLQKQGYEVGPVAVGALEQRLILSNGWLKGLRCANNFGFQHRSWRQGIKARVTDWVESEIKAGGLMPAKPA